MLSVLIVNWNTRNLLRACLRSIAAHPPSGDYEVIVVDNASADGSADMVAGEFPTVKLLARDRNEGYARGNNIAFAAARGDFLLTLNPDTEFIDDSLNTVLNAFDRYPKVGVIGVKQIGVDGRVQASVRGFPTMVGILGDVTALGRRFGGALDSYRLTRFDYGEEQIAPQPMGTFLMFRRAALDQTSGFFDESFPIFFNEVDLLYRLKQSGWDTLYLAGARILHHGGESTKQVRKQAIWESHRSLIRYLRKHHGTGLKAVGLSFLSAGIWLAAFVRAKGYAKRFEV